MDLKLVWMMIITIAVLANIILILVKWSMGKNGRKKIVANPNNPYPCKEHAGDIKEIKDELKCINKNITEFNKFCARFEANFNSLKENNEKEHQNFTIKLNGLSNRR